MPVTIPADGAWPSYMSHAARAFSSEESAAGIDESVDPLTRGQFSAAAMAFDRAFAAAARDLRRPLAQLRDELLHPLPAPGEFVRFAFHLRSEDGHAPSLADRGVDARHEKWPPFGCPSYPVPGRNPDLKQ